MKNKKLVGDFFHSEVNDYKKEFYESNYRTFMSVRLQRFLEEVDLLNLENCTVLDAGCGPGYLTLAFLERGFKTTALDSSPEMLRLTNELISNQNLETSIFELVEGNIEELPFDDNHFDLIASAGVIEYLENDEKVLNEFNRVLKPNGFLILSSTNKLSPIGYLEPIIEMIKRVNVTRNICNWFLTRLGGTPVRPRDFVVRKHSMAEFRANTTLARFNVRNEGYFYGLPWPHPFDRVFPKSTSFLGTKIEYLKNTFFRVLFEGLYVVCQKKS